MGAIWDQFSDIYEIFGQTFFFFPNCNGQLHHKGLPEQKPGTDNDKRVEDK